MKILVTGGAGFIGNKVTEILSKSHELKILDMKNPLLSEVGFVRGNILEPKSMEEAFEDSDVVVHLAGMLGVQNTEMNPRDTLDVNVIGTRNVLEACRKCDVRKIIYSSSSEVYGEPVKTPIEESDPPRPITVYGVSKLAAEEYVKAYATNYGIRYTILRFFSVYGSGQSNEFVIPKFVSSALCNIPLTIHGDGLQIRAFCHVSDIARGVLLALEKGDDESFNIGNGSEPISIKDLAAKVISMTSSESILQFKPSDEFERRRKNDIITRIPDTKKARLKLAYEPRVTLDEGILEVIHGFRRAKTNALPAEH